MVITHCITLFVNYNSHLSTFAVNPPNPPQARTDVEDKMQLSLDCSVGSDLHVANRFGSVSFKITVMENLKVGKALTTDGG